MVTTLTCAKHGVETRLRCADCGKPICLRCQVRTPVGLKCEECAALPARVVRRRRFGSSAIMAGGLLILLAGGAGAALIISRPGSQPASHALTRVGHWSSTADVPGVRGATEAVVLTGGKVLIAGGGVGSFPLRATSIYDPAADAWTPSAPLHVARRGHAMALLGDGRVLVAGGIDGGTILASTEVYDPLTRAWTEVGPMTVPRLSPSLATLADGRVLAAGGLINGPAGPVAVATAEIFDTRSATWTATSSGMLSPRYEATTTRLKDGRVLIVGGRVGAADDSAVLASAEVFDVAVNGFTRAGALHEGRSEAAAVLLADGTVLVTGGSSETSALKSTELFNPGTGSWRVSGALGQARRLHSATLLTNGSVLVVGGETVARGSRSSLRSGEVFDAARGIWSRTPDLSCARSNLALAPLAGGGALATAGDAAAPGQPPLAQSCVEVYRS